MFFNADGVEDTEENENKVIKNLLDAEKPLDLFALINESNVKDHTTFTETWPADSVTTECSGNSLQWIVLNGPKAVKKMTPG